METTIGARIRQLRETKRLSVADFATAAGVKPSAIYGLESGANKPSIETVASLRHSFPDLHTDWLLLGTGPMLRDGRALTPAPAAAPTPGLTSGPATVAEAENVLLRELLTSKNAVIDLLKSEVTELRGKSPGSSDAAGPYAAFPPVAPVPVVGFRLAVPRRAKGTAQVGR